MPTRFQEDIHEVIIAMRRLLVNLFVTIFCFHAPAMALI